MVTILTFKKKNEFNNSFVGIVHLKSQNFQLTFHKISQKYLTENNPRTTHRY